MKRIKKSIENITLLNANLIVMLMLLKSTNL